MLSLSKQSNKHTPPTSFPCRQSFVNRSNMSKSKPTTNSSVTRKPKVSSRALIEPKTDRATVHRSARTGIRGRTTSPMHKRVGTTHKDQTYLSTRARVSMQGAATGAGDCTQWTRRRRRRLAFFFVTPGADSSIGDKTLTRFTPLYSPLKILRAEPLVEETGEV